MANERAADLERALRARLVGEVLVVGECPVELSTSGVRPVGAPADLAALRAIVGVYDAALVTGWGKGLSPRAVVGELVDRVRPGGSIVVMTPTLRHGWRRAQGALLGVLTRRAPLPFEEICEAMLKNRLRDVVALEGVGPRGQSLVAARVREARGGAAESAIRGLAPGADSQTG